MVSIDVAKRSPEQRLHLIDEIWESLSADPTSIPFTEGQREELGRRLWQRCRVYAREPRPFAVEIQDLTTATNTYTLPASGSLRADR